MSGFSKLYVVGGLGGYQGADGVNPIEFLILIGDAHRQWLEPHYFDRSIKPMGKLRSMVPAGPDHPDALLDACIAFCPRCFESCRSLLEVKLAVGDAEHLDFDLGLNEIPDAWERLREEARPVFADMNIWRADLVRIERT